MRKRVSGKEVFIDGEAFYKIENYDFMTDFFMTITSSSDVWNFCWAQGGISAGRKNCDYSIFPYYTSDKIQDTKGSTGSVTIIKINSEGNKGIIWQPFENLYSAGTNRYEQNINIQRNIYKNLNGSKVWFEEVNIVVGLAFRYGWTSSSKYGLVKMCHIENLTDKKINVEILDGCKNIMSSSSDAALQNGKSVLLDAYKKSEVDRESNIALFSLSSIVTDKAEPSESLTTNVCWFTTNDPIILSDLAIEYFLKGKTAVLLEEKNEMNGKRAECYIVHKSELKGKSSECWEQVLDVNYDITKLMDLQNELNHKDNAWKILEEDIKETDKKLEEQIAAADGIQSSKNLIGDLHHRTNVMFNIMRGGIFCNDGKIDIKDFITFVETRNKALAKDIKALTEDKLGNKQKLLIEKKEMYELLLADKENKNNNQYKHIFFEYLPLTFSRRHGDPSRPWNRFNIELLDENGEEKINYEGNWRDIFQNWEALLWSYPEYAQNVCSIFLNAMTVEGFNPYRISREGLDWEVPDENDPWAQFGYWGDHQVIYLQKFLEFLSDYDKKGLLDLMNEKIFSTANIPYRIKSYDEVYKDPRNSIYFDYELDSKLKEIEKKYGTDARLILERNKEVQLTTMSTKLCQLVLAKVLNHIADAGIWMNNQRPEWNDANNALAGYGTSVVTMCYLHRMLTFLSKLLKSSKKDFEIEKTVADTLKKAFENYKEFYSEDSTFTDSRRKEFTDSNGRIFEEERFVLYQNGFTSKYETLSGEEIANMFEVFAKGIESSIKANKREDGLVNSYNTVILGDKGIKVINLKLMLEGQVAVLSCDVLSKEEKLTLTQNLRNSSLFEEHQHSYLLYPNTKLCDFKDKNNVHKDELKGLVDLIQRTQKFLQLDRNGVYHFNSLFRNADVIKEFISKLNNEEKPSPAEEKALLELYEKKFNHQMFTGRSGTFYCYEGIGCIYWHLVSKLLVAAMENVTVKKDPMIEFYKDVKNGLGSAKAPAIYGAFPYDPYSHTPYLQGARQPGMTGQVKEEILARWGELGLKISDKKAIFNPIMLDRKEYDEDGFIKFTWCGTKIIYNSKQKNLITVTYDDDSQTNFTGNTLPEKESEMLFSRSKKIKEIEVGTL